MMNQLKERATYRILVSCSAARICYRVFVVAVVAVSIAWIPIIQSISELFHYIQGITSFLAPPVCAVYVLAISWKRINEQVSSANEITE